MANATKDAEAKKRSEAAKKAAATRRRKIEEQEAAEREQAAAQAQPDEQSEQPQVAAGLATFRADVNPGDQRAAHERQEAERDAERKLHNERTGGTQ